MSTVTQSVQPIIIPDPTDPNYGPSADNIPIVSQNPGVPVTVASITNGSSGLFYNVAASLFPQPTGANYVYRYTFNGSISAATLASAGNVTLLVQVQRADTSLYGLAGQTIWVTNPLTQALFSVTAVWVPQTGDRLRILLINNTGGTMTNTTLDITTKGNGIELVSKAATQQLIYS